MSWLPSGSSRAARAWLRSGWWDTDFYAALRATRFDSDLAAARDFVSYGMPQRLSPHPFLDFASLPQEVRVAWRAADSRTVLAWLARGEATGPLAAVADPYAARAHMLVAAARIGRGEVAEVQPTTAPAADLVSVVVVATDGSLRVRRAVTEVLHRADLHHHDEVKVEVVVVDDANPAHVALALEATAYAEPRVRLLRLTERRPVPDARAAGFAASSGAVVAFLDQGIVVRGNWLDPLLAALADADVAGVQPLVLDDRDLIHAAGLGTPPGGGLPVPLLVGHPPEDAQYAQGLALPAACGAALVMRRTDVEAAGGLVAAGISDPADADLDLCTRLLAGHPGGWRLVASSVVSLRGSAGDTAPALRVDEANPWSGLHVPQRPAGSLRWTLQLPSPPGRWGDDWGDTHFGAALAAALRGLGQEVVTRRAGAHDAGPVSLDDVALAVRGLQPVAPLPGRVNVLWVISHPDEVTAGELDGYDLVFAASGPWSEQKSRRWQRPVVALPQATEFPVSPPVVLPPPGERTVVFVGSKPDHRERAMVQLAVEAGIPLAVYGGGWSDLPDGMWRGRYVPNHELPGLYRHHGLVLADHWADMARDGFVANRVFDAVAAGARVLCDDVLGIEDVFGPDEVVVCRTADDLRRAVAAEWPPPAARTADELSFRQRAEVLLAAVRAL